MAESQISEDSGCWALLTRWRSSRTFVIVVVFVAFLLDIILQTSVIPILPTYLYDVEYSAVHNVSTTTIEEKGRQLQRENGRIGILLAAKPAVQLIVAPFASCITARYGYSWPMFLGFVIMLMATLGFAFADTYVLLMASRAVQGLGTSFTSVAGPAMLAERYDNDQERGKALGHAMSGVSVGLAIGPIFGGLLYYYLGKPAPFIILAGLTLIDGILRLTVITPNTTDHTSSTAVSFWTIVCQPRILVFVGAPMIGILGNYMFHAILPIHMMVEMHASVVTQSLIFLPGTVAMFISQNVFGWLAYDIGRERVIVAALIMISGALVIVPLSKMIIVLVLSLVLINASLGILFAASMGALSFFAAEWKNPRVYGYVFALYESGLAFSFIVGPISGGFLVQVVGFTWTLFIAALINLSYAVLFGFGIHLLNRPANSINGEEIVLVTSTRIDK